MTETEKRDAENSIATCEEQLALLTGRIAYFETELIRLKTLLTAAPAPAPDKD